MSYFLSKDKLKNIKNILVDDIPNHIFDMVSFITNHTNENITPIELTRVFTMISCDLASLQVGGKSLFENIPISLIKKPLYSCALDLKTLIEKIATPEFNDEFNGFYNRIVLEPLKRAY